MMPSPVPPARNQLSWKIALGLTAAYTAVCLYPALTDWLPHALRRAPSLWHLGYHDLIDAIALLIGAIHIWLLLAMAFLNLLAVATCWQGMRRRSTTAPAAIYLGLYLVIGLACSFSDLRLYAAGLVAEDETFVMTTMWCLLAVPLWILGLRAILVRVFGQVRGAAAEQEA